MGTLVNKIFPQQGQAGAVSKAILRVYCDSCTQNTSPYSLKITLCHVAWRKELWCQVFLDILVEAAEMFLSNSHYHTQLNGSTGRSLDVMLYFIKKYVSRKSWGVGKQHNR